MTKHHLLQGNVALYSPPTLEDSSIIENRMIFVGSSDIFLDDTLPTYLCFAPPMPIKSQFSQYDIHFCEWHTLRPLPKQTFNFSPKILG